LHEKCYEDAKRLFNLNTALIQTARDKALEILKSFEEKKKSGTLQRLAIDAGMLPESMEGN